MVKELKLVKVIVPNEFVIGGIIAKLTSSWKDFATTLKHRRTHMSLLDLIVSSSFDTTEVYSRNFTYMRKRYTR
jgi:hypothetical protein